jgi:hypothetical protein
VVSQLDERYVAEVDDIINFPPQHDPYTTLKTEFIKRLCPSRDQRTRQLFTLEEMGDRKPSQCLKHLRSLAPNIPDNYLRILWTSRLPTNIQVILAGMPEVGLIAAAFCADRFIETVSPSTVASISPGPDYAELVQTVRNLSCQVTSFVAERSRPNSRERRPALGTAALDSAIIDAATHEVTPPADPPLEATPKTPAPTPAATPPPPTATQTTRSGCHVHFPAGFLPPQAIISAGE